MPDQFRKNPLLYYDTFLAYHGIDPKGLDDAAWLLRIKAVQHFREADQKPLMMLIKLLSA